MRRLRALDEVAYVRFASVYRGVPRRRRVHDGARGASASGGDGGAKRAVAGHAARPRPWPAAPPGAPRGDAADAVAEFFMRIALREATKGLGRTSPNPAVGAVARAAPARVVARGHHARRAARTPRVVAIRAAGARARGADLYTTLEPCDHFGRTPPVLAAILEAGVRGCSSARTTPTRS